MSTKEAQVPTTLVKLHTGLEQLWNSPKWVLAIPEYQAGTTVPAIVQSGISESATGVLLNNHLFEDSNGKHVKAFRVDNEDSAYLKVVNFAARCLGCRPTPWTTFVYSRDDNLLIRIEQYIEALVTTLEDGDEGKVKDFDEETLYDFKDEFLQDDDDTAATSFLEKIQTLHKSVLTKYKPVILRLSGDNLEVPTDLGKIDDAPLCIDRNRVRYSGASDLAYLPQECLSDNSEATVRYIKRGDMWTATVVPDPETIIDIRELLPSTAFDFRTSFYMRMAQLLDFGKFKPKFSNTTGKMMPLSQRYVFLLTQEEYTKLRHETAYWSDVDPDTLGATKSQTDPSHLEVEAILQPGQPSVTVANYRFRVVNNSSAGISQKNMDGRVVKALRVRFKRQDGTKTIFTTDSGEEVGWAVWRAPHISQYEPLARSLNMNADAVWAYVGWIPLHLISNDECIKELTRRGKAVPSDTSLLKGRVREARLNGIDVTKLNESDLVIALETLLRRDTDISKLTIESMRKILLACLLVDPTVHKEAFKMYRHSLIGEKIEFWKNGFEGLNYPMIKFGFTPTMKQFGVGPLKLGKKGIYNKSRIIYPFEKVESTVSLSKHMYILQKQTALGSNPDGRHLNFSITDPQVKNFVYTHFRGIPEDTVLRALTLPKTRNKDPFTIVSLARAIETLSTIKNKSAKTAKVIVEPSLQLVGNVVTTLKVSLFGKIANGRFWTRFAGSSEGRVHPLQEYKEYLLGTYMKSSYCSPENCLEAIAYALGVGILIIKVGRQAQQFHASCHAIYTYSTRRPKCWIIAQMKADSTLQLVVMRPRNGKWNDTHAIFSGIDASHSTKSIVRRIQPVCNKSKASIDVSSLFSKCVEHREHDSVRVHHRDHNIGGWMKPPKLSLVIDTLSKKDKIICKQIINSSGMVTGVLVPINGGTAFVHLPTDPSPPLQTLVQPHVYLDRNDMTFRSTLLSSETTPAKINLADCKDTKKTMDRWAKVDSGFAVRFTLGNKLLLASGEMSLSSSDCKGPAMNEHKRLIVQALTKKSNIGNNAFSYEPRTEDFTDTIDNTLKGSTVDAVKKYLERKGWNDSYARLLLQGPDTHLYDRVLVLPQNVIVSLTRNPPMDMRNTDAGDSFSSVMRPRETVVRQSSLKPEPTHRVVKNMTFNYDALCALLPMKEAWRAQSTIVT